MNGVWAVQLLNAQDRREAIKHLRSFVDLDIKEAAALLRSRDDELWIGTEVEANWLRERFSSLGIIVTNAEGDVDASANSITGGIARIVHV
ncbi:MAG: hypothetical protein HY698_05470 [Deltaproteobacteria bacterium]|nr:hypothetical protein [Deltaproteobacteria bacterium]